MTATKSKQGLALAWVALAQVALPQSRDAGHVVARPQDAAVTHAQWVDAVRAWCAAFQRVQGAEVALYCGNPLTFAAALWGAWHAGKTPVLASDLHAHTLSALLPQVAACAGELPQALVPDAAGADGVVLQPLDMLKARVVLFTSGSTGGARAH